MTSLNPYLSIGLQLTEPLRIHKGADRAAAAAQAIEMLKAVHITEPERRMRQYPHQLSGGMRQRVAIAMALICRPEILIADEPTTALDVTVQAQVLSLLREIRERFGTAMILVTHDLGVIAELARPGERDVRGKNRGDEARWTIFSTTAAILTPRRSNARSPSSPRSGPRG